MFLEMLKDFSALKHLDMCITLKAGFDCIGLKQNYSQTGTLGIYKFPLMWVRKTPSLTSI